MSRMERQGDYLPRANRRAFWADTIQSCWCPKSPESPASMLWRKRAVDADNVLIR